MNVSSINCCRVRAQVHRRADREHLARMHQRDAVAALRLVGEMGSDERWSRHRRATDRQGAPEGVARDRIDARGRLVEERIAGLCNTATASCNLCLMPSGRLSGRASTRAFRS